MELLITIRSVRLTGDVLQPGKLFKAVDPQPLIEGGYARRLTKKEISQILEAYVAHAQTVFAEKPFCGRGGNDQIIDRPPAKEAVRLSVPQDDKECAARPVPYGPCRKHRMKYSPATGGLEAYCTKGDQWCRVVAERTNHMSPEQGIMHS